MAIIIEAARSLADLADLHALRQAVFEREMGLRLPPFAAPSEDSYVHVLAREGLQGAVVAGLTVVETTGDRTTHQRYGLKFPDGAAVARCTRLAVLPAYRGQGLPLRLMLAAQRLFIVPRGIRYTWLALDARRAAKSDFCRLLGYQSNGAQCALVRDEIAALEVEISSRPAAGTGAGTTCAAAVI
jgi:GNAT superfamily N-acetyltransferase